MDLAQNLPLLAGVSAALGVLSHLDYFIHGEHHEEGSFLALLAIFIPGLLFTGQLIYLDADKVEAAMTTSVVTASYITALFTSMIIYRIFFHRLNNFPGPFLAKVSKLYHTALVIRKSDNYLLLDKWHQKYGAFVRTGGYHNMTSYFFLTARRTK